MIATPHYKVDKVSEVFKSPDIQVREYEVLAGQEIPWHFHSQITDHCYCLAGAISVEVQDGRTSPISNTVLKPGEKCIVKPGVAHRVTCAQGVSARYLLVQGGGQYDFNPLAGK